MTTYNENVLRHIDLCIVGFHVYRGDDGRLRARWGKRGRAIDVLRLLDSIDKGMRLLPLTDQQADAQFYEPDPHNPVGELIYIGTDD